MDLGLILDLIATNYIYIMICNINYIFAEYLTRLKLLYFLNIFHIELYRYKYNNFLFIMYLDLFMLFLCIKKF